MHEYNLLALFLTKYSNKSELQKVFNLPPCKISSFQIFLKIMRIKAFKLQNIQIVSFKFNFKYSSDIHSYNTRNKQNLHLECVNKNWGKQIFSYHAANDWNNLPMELREINQFKTFKIKLTNHLST